MNDATARPVFDRTTQDIGNIVEFGHVNVRVPDQRLAILFYVAGLGLTRDPYLVVGVDNAWMNVGTCQFHLPVGPAQTLRGVTGLVMEDLDALMARLDAVAPRLAGTAFGHASAGDHVNITCPWGNHIRVHAPDLTRFGPILLGMPYVEIATATGTTAGIARFYREILLSPASSGVDPWGAYAHVPIGRGESMIFRETDRPLGDYDGHHVQIALANFSGPHALLQARGLITEESNDAQYRFQDITDLDTGAVLCTIEHEVRSMRHPMYARALINRNPTQTNNDYAPGQENAIWSMRV